MAIKTGKQYIDSLRDGRKLYIDGKVVTTSPPIRRCRASSARSPPSMTTSTIPPTAMC